MRPIKTNTTNAELGKPANWDDEVDGKCEVLPVTRVGAMMYSYWKPTWRERLVILFGRNIRLTVAATGHPPVMLDTEI